MTQVNDDKEKSKTTEEELLKNKNGEEEELEEDDQDIETLRESNKKLFERAKKAEAERKAIKAERDALAEKANNGGGIKRDSDASAEELRLIAKGVPDEIIEKAKVIAKGNGTSLTEALNDPMLQSFQEKLKEEEKKAKAKLGASKGSAQGGETENAFKSGMSDEEHRKLWEKQQGN